MKASTMMMRSVLVGASAATLFLLPMSSLGIGFTILEVRNQRYVDGSYVPVPGLEVDYANISVSDDLIRIDSRHDESFSYAGSGSYIAISGGGYAVTFRIDEPVAFEIQGSTVRHVSGSYEGSGHAFQGVTLRTSVGNPIFTVYEGNNSSTGAGMLPVGTYTVGGFADIDYYGNESGFPYSFSATSGYEFSLQLRPLLVPDGGTTLGLLGFGLVGMAVLRRKKAVRQART